MNKMNGGTKRELGRKKERKKEGRKVGRKEGRKEGREGGDFKEKCLLVDSLSSLNL